MAKTPENYSYTWYQSEAKFYLESSCISHEAICPKCKTGCTDSCPLALSTHLRGLEGSGLGLTELGPSSVSWGKEWVEAGEPSAPGSAYHSATFAASAAGRSEPSFLSSPSVSFAALPSVPFSVSVTRPASVL